MMRLVSLIASLAVALVTALLGTMAPVEAFVAQQMPTVNCAYDGHHASLLLVGTASERGPPPASADLSGDTADDPGSLGVSESRDGNPTTGVNAYAVPAERAITAGTTSNAMPASVASAGEMTAAIALLPRGQVAANNGPRTLYHYTDDAGLKGILDSKQLNPSLKSVNPRDVRYGNGQYVSDIGPGTRTCAQLSRCFLGQPFQGQRFKNYVEIDVSGLNVVKGRDGVYVIPGDSPLDISTRLRSWGAN